MSKPKVSIITTTYNHENFIRQAVDSFLMQRTNFDYEVVVFDDASTDKTPQILEEYARANPGIFKLRLRKKNIGSTANSIEALMAAEAKYIAICEGDDYWTDPLKLQKQVDFLDNNSDYALCFHQVKVIYDDKPHKNSIWPRDIDGRTLDLKTELRENFIPTNSVMFRRQDYSGLPRDVMPLDWYLHLYNAKFGKIGYLNEVMSVYRRHQSGLWWANDTDKLLLWQKYGLSMLTLHTELLKLYGKSQNYREIVYGSIRNVFKELVSADQKKKTELVHEATTRFPEVASRLLSEQYGEIKNLNQELENRAQQIEALNSELISAREQAYELKDKLHALTHARLLGKIIKLRNFIGEARRALSVSNLIHQARVIGAPFVPRPLRLFLKSLYRQLRLRDTSYKKRRKLVITRNDAWSKELPLVSVIIPYYNRGDTIDDTIESLRGQSFKDFETIIVDDGSTESESIDKIKLIESDNTWLRVIHEPNQGVAAARNTGIAEAKGKYIICLDSDDVLKSTFIEKCTLFLETQPDISLVTTHMNIFGVVSQIEKKKDYNPLELIRDNMVITAAQFTKQAWQKAGGYKSNIGYEDWEFWLNLAEHGFWGRLIPEVLFDYRTSVNSRYIEDKDKHWNNIKTMRQLHPTYKKSIKKLISSKKEHLVVEPASALVNLSRADQYSEIDKKKKNVMITVPWMTFGGAETLIYNYCKEVKDKYNISFVTGLKSENEWEYKFAEISPNIYHLANLFDDPKLYLEFISNYISTRSIDILHIIHNGFTFEMLRELKSRHPKLRVCLSMFNDRVEYFGQSLNYQDYIDVFVTDNNAVAQHYEQELKPDANITVIPNGIDCYENFNPALFDRSAQRQELDISKEDMAVFFVGRMSEEKNPNVYVDAAKLILKNKSAAIKFFMIGDGPMGASVKQSVKEINDPRLVYLGYQSDVARYLSAADVFVLPSSIEGFPLSILESMAMRLAVVASRVGAVPDVIEDGRDGFIVPPGSSEDIKNVLQKLLNEKKLLEQVKHTARDKIEVTYSNKLLGDNYKKLYAGLLK